MELGSQAWARSSGGRLSQRERWQMLKQVMRRQLPDLFAMQLKRLAAEGRALDVAAVPLPDTQLCQEALDYCESVSPVHLSNHCLRTYFWGALLAQRQGLSFDPELFMLAALLHDLGLTQEHVHHAGCSCFAVAGAESAQLFLSERAYAPEKTQAVYEAISRHMNVTVGVQEGVEAHLLQAGAAYDVVGLNWQKIDSASRQQVLEKFPRKNFKKEFTALLQQDVKTHPRGRAAFYLALGFPMFVSLSPFNE